MEQDRQCTYDVRFSRVRATTVVLEKAINIAYSVCVFVAYIIFPHYLIYGIIVEKKVNEHKCEL
jgi:hypothetical protein